VPLLLMSSDKNVGTFIRQRFNPACDFIDKPVSFPLLISKIDEQTKGKAAVVN
jgi:FixJ family two-component response regulator